MKVRVSEVVPGGGGEGGRVMSMRGASTSIMPPDSRLGAEDFNGRLMVSWLVCGVGEWGTKKS